MESQAERIHGLDTLRALAILSVICFHAGDRLPHAFDPVSRFGWMGVDLFFVLSGYLIGSQLLKLYARGSVPSFREFYLRRSFRVLPAYLVVLTVYFLLPAFREGPGISPLWYFLSFTENMQIDYAQHQAFSHAWSLCVEEHFYLLLPALLFLVMRKGSVRKTIMAVVAVLCFGVAVRAFIFVKLVQPFHGVDCFPVVYIERLYFPTFNRLDGLLIGVVLATIRAFRSAWWNKMMKLSILLLGIGLLCTAAAFYLFADRFSFAGAVFGFPLLSIGLGLCTASSVSPQSWIGRRIPGAELLAALAYSLYLTHLGVLRVADRFVLRRIGVGPSWSAVVIYAASCLLAAATLYLCVERPFLRLRERLTSVPECSSVRVVGRSADSQQGMVALQRPHLKNMGDACLRSSAKKNDLRGRPTWTFSEPR